MSLPLGKAQAASNLYLSRARNLLDADPDTALLYAWHAYRWHLAALCSYRLPRLEELPASAKDCSRLLQDSGGVFSELLELQELEQREGWLQALTNGPLPEPAARQSVLAREVGMAVDTGSIINELESVFLRHRQDSQEF